MSVEEEKFQEVLQDELRAREAACSLLGVQPGAGTEVLKAAYRRAAMTQHPDRNPGDSAAARKFILIKCAYELLANGVQCGELLRKISSWNDMPETVRHQLDSPWGYFTWWRDNYF
ncbi:MAG: J domain-containing protein [candidate division FCPU426 bacterium]